MQQNGTGGVFVEIDRPPDGSYVMGMNPEELGKWKMRAKRRMQEIYERNRQENIRSGMTRHQRRKLREEGMSSEPSTKVSKIE